ncbi:MAG: PrsW family intramembrane metalloprotease [Gammaproteobacteria bacterium]|nr:PrsW family intramembrane metalloprotease [Gammaproteobacteria bacterium]
MPPDNDAMSYGLMLLPVLLPILFWGGYHYHKDRHLPEPVGHLALAFGLGLLSAAISRALYVALGWASLRYDALALADGNTLGLFAYSMLAIGPVEELAKMLVFLILVLKLPEMDEPIDGIIYASFVALGYAAVENVMYLDYLTPTEAAARGFAGPVVHILFASIWGYTIGCAHLRGESILRGLVGGFLLAAGLHGLYDFVVLQQSLNALPIAAIMIVVGWIWRLRLLRALHEKAVGGGNSPSHDCRD